MRYFAGIDVSSLASSPRATANRVDTPIAGLLHCLRRQDNVGRGSGVAARRSLGSVDPYPARQMRRGEL